MIMKNIVIALVIFVTCAYGGSFIYRQLAKYQQHVSVMPLAPPFLHIDGDDTPVSEFHAGQVFWLRFASRRKSTCLADINYRIIQEIVDNRNTDTVDDDVIKRRILFMYMPTKAVVPAGEYLMDVRFELPTWIEPGDYALDRSAVYTCEGMTFDRAPKIPFNVR